MEHSFVFRIHVLIHINKDTINTEQNDLNWKTKGFRFGEPDVIEVEFEPAIRKVTWKKVNVKFN